MQLQSRDALPKIMLARYYGNSLGRFLSVDPVSLRNERLQLPQRLNLYGYAANNPIKFIDPSGEDIALSSAGNDRTVRSYLVNTIMRPSGRAAMEKVANDRSFTATFQDKRLNSVAQVKAAASGIPGELQTGAAKPIVGEGQDGQQRVIGAEVSIDTIAIQETGRPDPSGVTTVGHEVYHTEDFRQQKSQGEVSRGDLPTSETGPAQQFGRSVSQEKPDITRKEAKRILKTWLEKSESN